MGIDHYHEKWNDNSLVEAAYAYLALILRQKDMNPIPCMR